jgi:hypothetical protein
MGGWVGGWVDGWVGEKSSERLESSKPAVPLPQIRIGVFEFSNVDRRKSNLYLHV